eukprot:3171539-Prymnesium_polylepis.1
MLARAAGVRGCSARWLLCVQMGYEDVAREHGTRVGRANNKGGPYSLSQCGCRPGLCGGPSCRARKGRGKGGAPRARCRAGCAYAHPPG